MKNKNTLIVIGVFVLAIAVYFLFFRKKAETRTATGTDSDSLITTRPNVQAPSNALLSGFDEGEQLRHNGQLFEVVNGAWSWMGQ